jgi:hypothetical protein
MSNQFNLEAGVHTKLATGAYRVKVSLLDIGMYINGCLVYPPNEEHDWAVYMPAQRAGRGIWKPIIEFNKKLPLWAEIYDACIQAVQVDKSYKEAEPSTPKTTKSIHKDVVLEDISEEPIDLSDIPF